jgi:hypothetical protein
MTRRLLARRLQFIVRDEELRVRVADVRLCLLDAGF